MSKITTKYYQKCDFCNKEHEVGAKGLPKINLPGYYFGGGEKQEWIVTGVICNECMQKLRENLRKFIDIKEIEYGGTQIFWNDEKEKAE